MVLEVADGTAWERIFFSMNTYKCICIYFSYRTVGHMDIDCNSSDLITTFSLNSVQVIKTDKQLDTYMVQFYFDVLQ